jgi:FkbM family methyltransferase
MEMSHLHYSLTEKMSIMKAISLPRKRHETRLGAFKVRYLDAASFRIVAFEVFVKADYFFRASHDAPVILDCGANIGLATLFFKRLYPKAHVYAFEADPTTAEVLRLNVEQNQLRDVTVSNMLLTDHEGSEKFYVAAGTPGSLMMSAVASRFSSDSMEISVPAGKLSTHIDGPIDLLKLDVEGSELAVIRDLVASGKIHQIARIISEYHHKIENERSRLAGFLSLLEETGFEYHIDAKIDLTGDGKGFQDILIHAYRL